jgi:hypothetical protein
MFFIYVSEFQEETPMENKKHWKRGKETLTGSTTLIYITSCRDFKGREIIRGRDPKRNINNMQMVGDISTGGVTLL